MAWEVPAETTVYENKCCVCGGGVGGDAKRRGWCGCCLTEETRIKQQLSSSSSYFSSSSFSLPLTSPLPPSPLLPLPLSTCPLLLSCWGWSPDPYTFYTNALLLEKLWRYILEGQGVYRDPEAAADLVGYCWAENGYGTVKEEESSSQGGGTDRVDLEDARSRWQS